MKDIYRCENCGKTVEKDRAMFVPSGITNKAIAGFDVETLPEDEDFTVMCQKCYKNLKEKNVMESDRTGPAPV